MRNNQSFAAFVIVFLAMALLVVGAQSTTVTSGVSTVIFGAAPGVTSGGRLSLPSSSGGLYVRETGNFTATPGGVFGVDCSSGSINIALPSNPADGTFFTIFDVSRSWTATKQPVIGDASSMFFDALNQSPAAGPYQIVGRWSGPFAFQPPTTLVFDSALNAWSAQ